MTLETKTFSFNATFKS